MCDCIKDSFSVDCFTICVKHSFPDIEILSKVVLMSCTLNPTCMCYISSILGAMYCDNNYRQNLIINIHCIEFLRITKMQL